MVSAEPLHDFANPIHLKGQKTRVLLMHTLGSGANVLDHGSNHFDSGSGLTLLALSTLTCNGGIFTGAGIVTINAGGVLNLLAMSNVTLLAGSSVSISATNSWYCQGCKSV